MLSRFAVLRARVNTQLRRNASDRSSVVGIDRFHFDFDNMEFRKDGCLIELSKTEQKLLRILIENRGRTLPRAVLVTVIVAAACTVLIYRHFTKRTSIPVQISSSAARTISVSPIRQTTTSPRV